MEKSISTAVFAMLAIFYLVILNVYLPDSGGLGFSLNINLIAGIGFGLATAVVFLLYLFKKSIHINTLLFFLLALVFSFFIISPFNHSLLEATLIQSLAVMTLISGIVITINSENKEKILYILVVSAVIQSLVGLYQYFFITEAGNIFQYNPDYNRPYGIFRQVNTFASFVATGMACAAYLLLSSAKKSIFILVSLLAAFSIMAVAVYFSFSRTAWLGALVVTLFALILNVRKYKIKQCFLASLSMMVIFVLLIKALPYFSAVEEEPLIAQDAALVPSVSTPTALSSSILEKNISQREYIYFNTIKIILDKPLLGYGYGQFQSAFVENFYKHNQDNTGSVSSGLSHPHNIILYLWMQGGALPVLVLFAMATSIMVILVQQRWDGLLVFMLLVPISIHLMVEHPFTASTPHIITAGLLLGFIPYKNKAFIYNKPMLVVASLISILVIVPAFTSMFFANKILITYEALQDKDKVRGEALLYVDLYKGPLEDQFDIHLSNITFANAMQEKKAEGFKRYLAWSEEYLERNPRQEIFRNTIMANLFIYNKEKAEHYYRLFVKYYPHSTMHEKFKKYFL